MNGRIGLTVVAGLLLGCGDSDSGATADFNGLYSGTSTNSSNNCPGPWNMGEMATGQVNLAQSGSDVQFQAQGATGIAFFLAFGSASFSGKAKGNHVDAAIVGSVTSMAGSCGYTWKGTLAGNLVGDTLEGTLQHTPTITTPNADCEAMKVTGCSRLQLFSYTRPAK